MLLAAVSRLTVLLFGVLYPAFKSYQAIKTKNTHEHIRWMMHWVVFAAFHTVEFFVDMFPLWIPFYYELKLVLIIWLICPMTRGSSLLYRRIMHPWLEAHEKEIDEAITKASQHGYHTLATYGARGINMAASSVLTTVLRGQTMLVQRSLSLNDLSNSEFSTDPIRDDLKLGSRSQSTTTVTRRTPTLRSHSHAARACNLSSVIEESYPDSFADGDKSSLKRKKRTK